jgi:L-amino acid N-acyltransferase YncA
MNITVPSVAIEPMAAADWPAVAAIYREGIATGHATFASAPPDTMGEFLAGCVPEGSLVVRDRGVVMGWTRLTRVSGRCVYAGVAEVSLYVAEAARGRGLGKGLLGELVKRSESADIWTLQAGIFPENAASVALHVRHGFREVGRRERMGKMTFGAWAGKWRDVLLLERRSAKAGID